jgi:hypothetical protein
LETEDFVVQAVPEASPAKWHLAHATWFFETFVLKAFVDTYSSPFPVFEQVFNSYYNAVGPAVSSAPNADCGRGQQLRKRSLIAASSTKRFELVVQCARFGCRRSRPTFELGLHHEQQHQELCSPI